MLYRIRNMYSETKSYINVVARFLQKLRNSYVLKVYIHIYIYFYITYDSKIWSRYEYQLSMFGNFIISSWFHILIIKILTNKIYEKYSQIKKKIFLIAYKYLSQYIWIYKISYKSSLWTKEIIVFILIYAYLSLSILIPLI